MPAYADVLAVKSLALEPVVTSEPEASVSWTATTELLDLSPYLEGGEVVLTTGLSLGADDARWDVFVERLAGRKIAALGFAVEVNHPTVPAALVEAATRHEMNLFVVPPPVPFIAVTKAIAGLLANDELLATRQTLSAQRDILNAALGSGGRTAIIERLAAAIGAQVAIVNSAGQTVAITPGAAIDERVSGLIERMRSGGRASMSEFGPDGGLYVHPLSLRMTTEHYLVVATRARLSPSETGAVTAASILLSLDEERENASRTSNADVQHRIAATLLSGDVDAVKTVLRVLRPLSAMPHHLSVVRISGPAELRAQVTSAVDRDGDLFPLCCDAAELSVTDPRPDDLLVIAPPAVAGRIARLAADSGGRAGIGRAASPALIHDSYLQAGWSLESTTGAQRVVHWSERAELGVMELIRKDSADTFARSVLGNLLSDGKDGEMLLTSLETFLAEHGQLATSANLLGIHRNTLRLRLRRVEELTGLALDSMQDRVDLWVALQAQKRMS
jgi:purine catabolism regulator